MLSQMIEKHAADFAQKIIAALRGASIDELVGLTGARAPLQTNGTAPKGAARTRGGRLPRRSADDIAKALEQVVAVLTAHPEGLRAEGIRAELGLDAKELPRPLQEGLATGRLTKRGQKRATVYTLGSGGGSVSSGKKRAAKKRRVSKK